MIPKDLASLSTDWLTGALQAPIDNFTVVNAHAGTTGRALLELSYGEAVDLPPRLFVKLPPTDAQQRQFVTSSGMGRREARFYSSLSAELPVRVPRCYFAASDEAGEDYIMLLENLVDSGCTFRNASSRYSPDYIREVLAAFARLHAAYWASPRFATDLAWVQPPLQHEIGAQLIARALQLHAAKMPAVFTDMGELYLAQADAIHRLWSRGEQTLIHGDVHDGNLFYDSGQPGFLDWAVVARGPALRDVGYFLAGTLTLQDQGASGRAMLAYYRERLLALGAPAPPLDELWRQYQWHAAYVWLGAAVTLAMGDAWQPVNYLTAALERLHAALDHLGSVEAIRSAL
jgi:aminoglycoside phosphotransferase (APT) family kinase protein